MLVCSFPNNPSPNVPAEVLWLEYYTRKVLCVLLMMTA